MAEQGRWGLRLGGRDPRYFATEADAKQAAFAHVVHEYGLRACASAALEWFGLVISIAGWDSTTIDQRYMIARRVASLSGVVITIKERTP